MAQTPRIIQTLKTKLKQQGITYRALAHSLELSESAVKQMFATGDMSLSRLDRICDVLSIDISTLVESMESDRKRLRSLSLEQEKQLISNPKLLVIAYCLVNQWSYESIVREFEVADHEAVQLMVQLDKMQLIELLPGNRAKALISSNFDWIPNGPIEQFFRKEAQGPFFDSDFDEYSCLRLVKNGSITSLSRRQLCDRLAVLGQYFDDLVTDEKKLTHDERTGTTMVLAIRNWEFEAFTQFRRKTVTSAS